MFGSIVMFVIVVYAVYRIRKGFPKLLQLAGEHHQTLRSGARLMKGIFSR